MVARSVLVVLASVLGLATQLSAQGSGSIVGRVTDGSTQQGVPGVSVFVGSRGTITDAQGRYRLAAIPAGARLVRAVMTGYKDAAQTVNVNADQTVSADFALETQAIALSGLVVVGYGTQRAANVTGSVKQVTAEQFNTGRVVTPQELIQSKVPGVQVVDNNEPGGGTSIRIRGATSINASSDPLFVVDGVPLGTGSGAGISAGRDALAFLNPADIESITVLKDAAAAAIYGANASNGVVLIQTRKGAHPTFEFDYSGSLSGSQITRSPDMLNATEFRAAVQQYAPQNMNQLQSHNTNWFDLVTRSAFGQEHNLAVSRASGGSALRASMGYLDQQGIIEGSTIQRLSGLLNFQQRLFDDRLSIRTSLKGSRVDDLFTPGGVISNAAQMGPTQRFLNNSTATGYFDWPGGLTSADNPVAILALASDEGITDRGIGNLQLEYSLPFIEGLRVHATGAYDITKLIRETMTPGMLHSQIKTGAGGVWNRRDEKLETKLFETYLNYAAPTFLTGSLDLVGGYSYSEGHATYKRRSESGLNDDGTAPPNAVIQQGVTIDDNKLISFFGRLNYNWGERFILTASLRRDGSSRFGENEAWGTFPAVALALRLSDAVQNVGLSDLKLRGSWGKTGNQSFANYQQYTAYQPGDEQTQIWFGDEYVTTVRPSAADPNIKWEETDAYNFGIDYGFANNRVTGTIDLYRKDTNDLIFTVPVAAGTNLSNFLTTNIGSMRNSGIELSLSAAIIEPRAGSFSWSADFTAGYNKNELTQINPFGGEAQRILTGSVSGGVGTLIQVLTPGQPINAFYVYQHKIEDGKPMYRDVTGIGANGEFNNTPDGTINEHDLYVDQNGDNRITVDDRRPYEDPAPDWIIGHSSYLTYGKLDMSFTLRAYLGNYVYNNVASQLGTYAEVTRGSPYNLHRSVLETGFTQPQYLSDYYVEDASFLRMDNITLGYNLTWRGQPLRLFGTVQNVFTLTGYSGVDPTAGLNGLDNNIYPRSRTFAAGLNVRF